jgi:fumarate reductase flavoprotein subunit
MKDEFEKSSKFDLLIIGAGTAGMACAITAAENGTKVLVIEKTNRIGGTLHVTGGHLSGGGSRRQKQRNIEDSPEHHFAEVMEISRNTADKAIVRLATQEAPKTLDWLDDLGFAWDETTPKVIFGHVPYKRPRTHFGVNHGHSIFKVLEPLWDKFAASGNIGVLCNHKLEALLTENGKVVGAVANGKSFYAENTVLATGGYAGNPEYFAKLHPERPRLITAAPETSSGEGIEIAAKIGGKIWNTEKHLSSLGGVEVEPNSSRTSFWEAWAMVYTAAYRPPREIYVNAEGKRFMAEDEVDADVRERHLERQTDEKFWTIFDENALTEEGMTIVPSWSVERIRAEAEKENCAWKAETIAELADKIGVPKQNLVETVAEFNCCVKTQKDGQFGRTYLQNSVEKSPFYALLSYAASLISFGGLAVNGDLQVINKNDNPIPNLYAIGEIIGAGATTGNAFCSGMLVTPALSFGRILGRKLSSESSL